MWILFAISILLVLLAGLAVIFTWRKEQLTTDESHMMYYEDGLLEVFFGLMLIFFGATVDTYSAFTGIAFALLYPFLLAAKQSITKPRLRPEELSAATAKTRRLSMFMVLGLALLFGVLFFQLTYWTNPGWLVAWLDQYLMLVVTLVIAVFFASWGYQSGIGRLHAYSALFLLAYGASVWLNLAFPIYVLAIGVVITLIGLTVMAQFIQEHPKINGGDPSLYSGSSG